MTLPDLYQRWLHSVLEQPAPSEGRATCDDCAMCPDPDGAMLPAAYAFRPDTKCCTYEPVLPNFLVGGILRAAPDDRGRTSVEERIRIGRATPVGLIADWRRRTRFDGNVHGRSAAHRCPHFAVETGSCSIWQFRPHACVTYFCKHERGRRGLAFWTAVGRLLKSVEEALASWCILEAGLPSPSQELCLVELERDPSDPPNTRAVADERDEAVYGTMWGEWNGREAEFYETCIARVGDLEWADVERIAGPRVGLAANVVRRGRDVLASDGVPERLALGSWTVLGANPGALTVQTHSPTDPIAIDQALLGVMHCIDGRPTEEVLAEMRSQHGVELDSEALRILVDFGVLTEG